MALPAGPRALARRTRAQGRSLRQGPLRDSTYPATLSAAATARAHLPTPSAHLPPPTSNAPSQDTALLLNNLAATVARQGEPAEARLLYLRAAGLHELAGLSPADPQARHVRDRLHAVGEELRQQRGPGGVGLGAAEAEASAATGAPVMMDEAAEILAAANAARRELEREAAAQREKKLRPVLRTLGGGDGGDSDGVESSLVRRELLASKAKGARRTKY